AYRRTRVPDRGVADLPRGRVQRSLRAHPSQCPRGAAFDRRLRTGHSLRRRGRRRSVLAGRAARRRRTPAGEPAPVVLGQEPGQLAVPQSVASGPPRRLVIASRESRLAMWQAEHVRDLLQALYPGCEIRIDGMSTEGDRIQDRALYEIGGKALFIKELEHALLDGRADLAVHSLKDVPMILPEPFTLVAVLAREDPRDAFVSNRY